MEEKIVTGTFRIGRNKSFLFIQTINLETKELSSNITTKKHKPIDNQTQTV